MKSASRGQCRECRVEYAVRADGLVRVHDAVGKECPGSKQPPAEDARKHVSIRKVVAKKDEEKYRNVDKFPALKRALIIKRVLDEGGSRVEAEKAALEKVGPRAPRFEKRSVNSGRRVARKE